ncbi:MAG: hypothetical protein FWD71_21675 [Oscillospiraceae bacterium]|nr:hypothetical protein [Oscillospiraceae bacterium]
MINKLFNQDITLFNFLITNETEYYKRTFIKNCHYEKNAKSNLSSTGVETPKDNFVIIRNTRNYIAMREWLTYYRDTLVPFMVKSDDDNIVKVIDDNDIYFFNSHIPEQYSDGILNFGFKYFNMDDGKQFYVRGMTIGSKNNSAEIPLNKWTLAVGGDRIATYVIRGDYNFEFDIDDSILHQIELFEKEMQNLGIEFKRVKSFEEFLNISPMINHLEVIC